MTAISRNPSNPNLLQVNKYILTFTRCPNLTYFCQSLMVPGVSKVEIMQNTPFVDRYVPGEKSIYDLLNITFLIDEELTAWLEIHDWIRALTFPVDFKEYQDLSKLNKMAGALQTGKPQYSDGSLILLSSSNKPYYKFKFYDMFPTSVSSFIMNSSESPESVLTADATFRYSYFDIEKLF